MITQEKTKRKQITVILAVLIVLCAVLGHYLLEPWGFYWKISQEEAALRLQVVKTAQSHLGSRETDGSHQGIIDLYNSHEPLAIGYEVQYTDSWCSTFVSAVAIQTGLTDIIPTECGCERHIGLFQSIGRWEENDNVIPLPGDVIFYDWDQGKPGDATGWSDHVGIVVGTKWPLVKVIEGNKDDCVSYRYLLLGDWQIRGYGLPDYASKVKNDP